MDLTAQEVIDIINRESTKYKTINDILVHTYVGDMTIECTYDYIFEYEGDSYVVKVILGDPNDYNYTWEEDFLDSFEDDVFVAMKGNYYNFPVFVKHGDDNSKLAQICLDFYSWKTNSPSLKYNELTGTPYKANIDEWFKNKK